MIAKNSNTREISTKDNWLLLKDTDKSLLSRWEDMLAKLSVEGKLLLTKNVFLQVKTGDKMKGKSRINMIINRF